MKSYVVAAALFVATVADASPIYLECTTLNQYSGITTNYKVTLDEMVHTATFSDNGYANGKTYTRPAQFAQTDVKYSWTSSVLPLTINYRIDRTNMEFSRDIMGDKDKPDYGTCKIAKPVKRRF